MSRIQMVNKDAGFILNVNKPKGKTSFSVVSYVKRLSGIKKVGHAGTLDPLATGVLLIVAGRATKQVENLMTLEKEYVGTVKFGIVTDTYDSNGRILSEEDAGYVTESAVRNKLKNFNGKIKQVPPSFSALKYKGKPLYKYARKGEIIKPEPREVMVHSIELESFSETGAIIRVVCSRGTYIRSIAHDLGQKLGCGAILSGLIRVRIGNFHVDDAVTWEDLPKEFEKFTAVENGSN